MFNIIKTKKDVENFLNKTNALHDGYIIGVQYTNGGITKLEYGHHFNPEQTKLIIQVLVTSIFDAIVEIELNDINENVKLPPLNFVKDVTDDKKYRNSELAKTLKL